MGNSDCVVGARNEEAIRALQKKDEELAGVDEQLWQAVNALRNRPPVWCTAAISFLSFLAGLLAMMVFR